jgi:TonB family protein
MSPITSILLFLAVSALAQSVHAQAVELIDPAYFRVSGLSKSELQRANMRSIERTLSKQFDQPIDGTLTLREFVVPDFSSQHIRADLHGTVKVRFRVDKRGRTKVLKVIESASPHLEDSVTDAVEIWEFEPIKRNGEAIVQEFILEITFARVR